MTLSVGATVVASGKVRKPTTVWERLMAEDDDLLHEGEDFKVTEVLKNDDADLAELYRLSPDAILKLCRRVSDTDLVENEAHVLRHLNEGLKADSTFYHYIPRLKQTVTIDGLAGNILSFAEGYVSLAEVLRAYPKGLDFRDMVWMYKRLLVGLGFAHSKSVVHGAIVPSHVLIHPTDHGAILVDWSYAITDPNDRIKAMSILNEDYYAPEIRRKESPKTATDLFMAAKCAVALVGGDVKTGRMPDSVPEPIRDFFAPSLEPAVRYRPQDAWGLHEQFDALLLKVIGKRAYRPFSMPGTKT